MSDIEAEIPNISDSLRSYIDQQFNTGKGRVYLSTMGSDLAEVKQQIESRHGLKFGEFIQQHLDYPVGRTGEHLNVLFLVPPGSSTEVDDDKGPQFVRSFWTAFARPIEGSEKRFINLKSLRFADSPEAVGGPSDVVLEIEKNFIAAKEKSRDVEDMTKRIGDWLAKHSLEKDRFLFRKKDRHVLEGSILRKMIDNLSSEQLKRVSLPLDVIKSLI